MTHPRLRADNNCDYEQFMEMIRQLLRAAWGEDWGTFCEAFPNGRDPQSVKFPVITHSLIDIRPGIVGSGNTREIKPRIRDHYVTESTDGSPASYTVKAQSLEHQVVFEVWEENNVKANDFAKRFRHFLTTYTGFFMERGVQQLIFDHQNNKPETDKFRDDIVCRKIVYYARMEDQIVIASDVIRKVTGSVGVIDNLSDNSINESQIDFKLS